MRLGTGIAGALLVGVVVALLIPWSRTAREEARKRSCQANIRYMAFALQFYMEASDGRLPPSSNPQDEYYWVKPLFGETAGITGAPDFYGMSIQMVQCPSALARARGTLAAGPQLYSRRKPSGVYVQYKWNPHLAGRKLDEIDSKGTILAYDCAPLHQGGRNCCFLDGHLEWLSEEQFRQKLTKPKARQGDEVR